MKTLRGDKVLLRTFLKKDAPAIASIANNKKIADQLRDLFSHPYTEEDAIRFIESQLVLKGPPVTFCIEYKQAIAGVIGLIPQVDIYRYNAEIGYWLGEPFWGKGLAKEAASLMVNYAFDDLNYRRLFAGVFDFNEASKKVLEANGFFRECIAEAKVFKNGQFYDEWLYALLNPDFQQNKK